MRINTLDHRSPRDTRMEVSVPIGGYSIPYLVTDDISAFADRAAQLQVDRWILTTSRSRWADGTLEAVERALGASAPVSVVRLCDTENGKTLGAVETVLATAIDAGVSRASAIVGIGGGVINNIAGLCASVLFRGITLVQVPTTLLAMSDAVVSLKQAVNFAGLKNGVGAYYPADLVWANTTLLGSLDGSAIRCGIAELIKNALVISPDDIDRLKGLLRPDATYDVETLTRLVHMALDSKVQVLRNDPKEREAALLLEYGHTTAHTLEMLSDGAVTHGLGVALGMRVAARVASQLGVMGAEHVSLHDDLLRAGGLPLRLTSEVALALAADDLHRQRSRDNKRGYIRTRPDEVAMVLISAPGAPLSSAPPLTAVPIALVVDTILNLLLPGV